jgi:hypothetical protein
MGVLVFVMWSDTAVVIDVVLCFVAGGVVGWPSSLVTDADERGGVQVSAAILV